MQGCSIPQHLMQAVRSLYVDTKFMIRTALNCNPIWSQNIRNKNKGFTFWGTNYIRVKLVVNNKIIKQINHFNFRGCDISYIWNEDPFRQIPTHLGAIKRPSLASAKKDKIIKLYKAIALPTVLYSKWRPKATRVLAKWDF